MVHQTAGGSHHDLRVLPEGVDLRLHGLPAIHGHDGKAGDIFAQLLQLLGDLQAELPGGAQDDPLHIAFFRLDALHHRHTEGTGLTGTGGGLGDYVPPFQHGGDAARLHRGGLYNIALH